MKRIVKCCCEQTTIEVDGDPEFYGLCHCDNCKRRTGSAFGVSAYFENDQIIAKTGETYVYEKTNWLGDQKRYFCKNCGTTLFWTLSEMANKTGVAGGCFTDNPLLEPKWTISQGDHVHPWVKLPDHWDRTVKSPSGDTIY